VHPQRADLQLLKFSGIAQKIAFAAILGFCGWTGMDFVTKMRSDAWKLAPDDAQTMEVELAKLQKERREWQHWDRLLEKRSEGWLALEALLELFPADGGVILRDANYRAEASDGARNEESKTIWDCSVIGTSPVSPIRNSPPPSRRSEAAPGWRNSSTASPSGITPLISR
jgi:hypothetical protein